MKSRRDFVARAELAQKAGRYDDMASAMRLLTQMPGALSDEERDLLCAAYRNRIGDLSFAWKLVRSAEEKAEEGRETERALEYRVEIEESLRKACEEALEMFDGIVFEKSKHSEDRVVYLELKGDIYRHLSDLSGEAKSESIEESKLCYQEALNIAASDLPFNNHIRLGLVLKCSVFYFEVVNAPDKAYNLAKTAFDNAMKKEWSKKSELIMELLKENLTKWRSESTHKLRQN